MNFGNDTIGGYINDIKLQAEDLVMDKFPRRFLNLEALLKSADFNVSAIASAHNKTNSGVNIRSDDGDGNVSKKQKLDTGLNSASSNNCSEQVAPSNSFLVDAVELIKPHIRQLLEDTKLLEMWIQLLTPRNEFTNDLTNSLLSDIYNEIEAMESNGEAFSDQISAYFQSRGKIITKVMKYPQLDDYRRTVKEMDENFHHRLRATLCDVRNCYAALYEMISKNLEKIKKPRNFDPRLMY